MVRTYWICMIGLNCNYHFLLVTLVLLVSCDSRDKIYYESGELKGMGRFGVDTIRDGEWFFFTKEGDTSEVHLYNEGNMLRKDTYISGNLFLSESMNGKYRDGETIAYHADGSVQSRGFYENGTQHGPFKSFYENGQIKAEGAVDNDILFGVFKQYHQNGKLFIRSEQVGNGIHFIYDSLGELTHELQYRNGVLLDTLKSY